MKDERAWGLLGGYATGSLTEEEQRTLYEAALADQELFDALAQDQALKDLLDDPASRRLIATALEPKPAGRARWWTWATVATAAVICTMVLVRQPKPQPTAPPAPAKVVADGKSPEVVGESLRSKHAPLAKARPAMPLDAMARQAPLAQFKEKQELAITPGAIQSLRANEVATPMPAALTYTLWRQSDTGGWEPVPHLRTGDRVRVRIRAKRHGSVSLFEQDADGASTAIVRDFQVDAQHKYELPGDAMIVAGHSLRLVFRAQAGASPLTIEIK